MQRNRGEQHQHHQHQRIECRQCTQQRTHDRDTPNDKIEPGQSPPNDLRFLHKLSLPLVFNCIDSSSSCLSSMVPGASSMTSRPLLFLGKAIKSRMLSLPPRIAQSRSKPKAIPPCGGAPYSKAPNRKPNLCKASSGVIPSAANIFSCNSR